MGYTIEIQPAKMAIFKQLANVK